jgi:membrane associated rhomboid family serine protease
MSILVLPGFSAGVPFVNGAARVVQRSCQSGEGLKVSDSANEPGNWKTGVQQPVFNAPWSVLALIAVLAGIHAALQYGGQSWQSESLFLFALIPARFTEAGFPMIAGSEYWSLITYGFLHGDWMHLLFNGLWLLIFGTPVARYLGSLRFFVLCAIATVIGGLASLALHWGTIVFVLGASGAVSGLLGAAIPIMYGRRVPGGVRPLLPTELIRSPNALIFMTIWLVITLVSGATGWTGNSFVEESGIAWEAHLGGFVGGIAGFYLLAQRTVRPV